MLEEVLQRLSGDSGFALWAPFFTLVLCGLGLPLPEDVVLFASGLLGAQNDLPVVTLILTMYFGILFGDTATFLLGLKFGRPVMESRIGKIIFTEARINRAEEMFQKHGSKVIFAGRFLPGLRAPIFFSAGLLKFSILRFWLMDGFAALISAPFFVWIGHWAWIKYADDFDGLEKTLGQSKILVIVFVVLAISGFYFWKKSRFKK